MLRLKGLVAMRKDAGPIPTARRIEALGAKPGKHPGFIQPALATLKVQPPSGDRYVNEIKFDGYRLQAHLRGGLPTLYTRS